MTIVIRALSAQDKSAFLEESIRIFREGSLPQSMFEFEVEDFASVPGTPFAYWLPQSIVSAFRQLPPFESNGRVARAGMQTSNDFRFVRAWWEPHQIDEGWPPFAKGGRFSPFFADLGLVVNWRRDGSELKAFNSALYGGGHWSRNLRNVELYGRPGFTYPRRLSRLSVAPLPKGAVISIRGSGIYGSECDLLAIGGLLSSSAFDYLTKSMLGRFLHPQFDNSVIAKVPVPLGFPSNSAELASAMKRSILAARRIFEVSEISHQFLLPLTLIDRVKNWGPLPQKGDFDQMQAEIDRLAFQLYALSHEDQAWISTTKEEEASISIEEDEEEVESEDGDFDTESVEFDDGSSTASLSWGIGVAFGRFDWRLATGERDVQPDIDPFAPLPSQSPGMLPDGAEPFRVNAGILVDDQGHACDLVQMIEDILARVETNIPSDLRRWLRREFFPAHLKQYSLGGRKAPIYWQLSSTSGGYTLWIYYPLLNRQTLYSAVNDFVEPKLKQLGQQAGTLRVKGNARSRDEERNLETLQTLEQELGEMRDTLLQIAPTYQPNHDDGVQITAAPLWPLFRHKPWQKLLKETWEKLENGDYDWSHLAMAYWPDRVREKCKTDKSLAIAHGLEELYEPPPKSATGAGRGGRKRRGAAP